MTPDQNMYERLLNAKQLAEALGVPRSAIYEWGRTAHPVPAYRVGTAALRYKLSEVTAWLATRQRARRPADQAQP